MFQMIKNNKLLVIKIALTLLAILAHFGFLIMSFDLAGTMKVTEDNHKFEVFVSYSFGLWGLLVVALFCIWMKSGASIKYRLGVLFLSSAFGGLLIYQAPQGVMVWDCIAGFTTWILLKRESPDWATPPKSILVAAAGLIYFLILNGYFQDFPTAVHRDHSGGAPVLAFIILIYLLKKNRLAWQWGRLGMVVTAIFVPLLIGAHVYDGKATIHELIAQVILMALPALIIAIALSRPQAKSYFRLVCPQCQSMAVKAADLFYRRVKCKKCGNVWPTKS